MINSLKIKAKMRIPNLICKIIKMRQINQVNKKEEKQFWTKKSLKINQLSSRNYSNKKAIFLYLILEGVCYISKIPPYMTVV